MSTLIILIVGIAELFTAFLSLFFAIKIKDILVENFLKKAVCSNILDPEKRSKETPPRSCFLFFVLVGLILVILFLVFLVLGIGNVYTFAKSLN